MLAFVRGSTEVGIDDRVQVSGRLDLPLDRPDFDRRAYRLRQTADVATQAAEAHDPHALLRALDGVDKACEGCHLHYFYPNDKRAWQAAKAV